MNSLITSSNSEPSPLKLDDKGINTCDVLSCFYSNGTKKNVAFPDNSKNVKEPSSNLTSTADVFTSPCKQVDSECFTLISNGRHDSKIL